MAHWRLAKSLIKLRDQINIAAPHRSKISDGSIGDQAHSSRVSDHNPDANGVVAAIDVTVDPVNGVDGDTLSAAVTADPRTKYVIYSSKIWKARTGRWEIYRGSNPHRKHVHISVKPDRYDNVEPWSLTVSNPSTSSISNPPSRPVLKRGDRGEAVRELQAKLRKFVDVSIDGNFGRDTEQAVRIFQRMEGLDPDGKVGEVTWKKLG